MTHDEPTGASTADRPSPPSGGALLWLLVSLVLWWVALLGSAMTAVEVADLATGDSHAGVELTLPARLARVGLFLGFAALGWTFVRLQLTGRVPAALPHPPPDRAGPRGLRRVPWYFYSFNAPLGRGRGLAVLALRFVGLVWLAVSPFMWAEDRRFAADGVLADTGVVVGKREVARGDSTARVLDVAYADHLGRTHRATWEENRWPRGWAWDGVSPGDRLPAVEFLRAEPERFRLVQRRWEPWEYPLPGLVLLAAAAVLVWSADWFPAEAVAGGSG